ncbi:MAG: hypothetical protein ACI86M_001321 [Saprospiraceae bacterium]|jgi:hypothetical protein
MDRVACLKDKVLILVVNSLKPYSKEYGFFGWGYLAFI